jgi:hypothetical protein
MISSKSVKIESSLTSVLIAKVGFQPSGGIILQMPYLLPSGPILRMYSIGSRNSSSVGRKVGASEIPNKRSVLGSSLGWPGCPLLGTCDMSRGSARLALSGIAWLLPDGGPFNVPGADIIGVFPLMPGWLGIEFGLSSIPSGVAIAWKVGPWAIGGMAMSATQWARRPRFIGVSQNTSACRVIGVRVGGRGRRGAQG